MRRPRRLFNEYIAVLGNEGQKETKRCGLCGSRYWFVLCCHGLHLIPLVTNPRERLSGVACPRELSKTKQSAMVTVIVNQCVHDLRLLFAQAAGLILGGKLFPKLFDWPLLQTETALADVTFQAVYLPTTVSLPVYPGYQVCRNFQAQITSPIFLLNFYLVIFCESTWTTFGTFFLINGYICSI